MAIDVAAPLAGLRVWVTRPAPSNTSLSHQLQQRGATVIAIPAMRIEPLSSDDDVARITTTCQSLTHYDALVFVSANAAAQFLGWMQRCHAALPITTECFAIGTATADCVRGYCATVQAPQRDMHSEGLLVLPALQQVAGRRFLILCGQGGRGYLGDALRERGASVDYCALYSRVMPTDQQQALRALAQQRGCDMWVASSGETVKNALLMAGDDGDYFRQLPVVVPGERVAGIAQTLGCQHVITAHNATDNATIDAVLAWYAHQ